MECVLHLELPWWVEDDTTPQERIDIMSACGNIASKAFYKKLDSIYEQRKASEQLESEGQLALC